MLLRAFFVRYATIVGGGGCLSCDLKGESELRRERGLEA